MFKIALIGPVLIIVLGADYRGYLAWRARVARWRQQGREPAPEYQRDNRLWTVRVVLFAVTVAALTVLFAYLFFGPGSSAALIWSLYGLAMTAAVSFSLLRGAVR